jgi:methylphosphotriester-DNA--protein-cysteine methyltransferase
LRFHTPKQLAAILLPGGKSLRIAKRLSRQAPKRAGCPFTQIIEKIKMAQHGGKRAGAGRKPGAISKAKRALAEKAKDHADDALRTLVEIMNNSEENGTTRISAANSILDRGFGKPFQATVDMTPEQLPQAFDGWKIDRAEPDTPDAD